MADSLQLFRCYPRIAGARKGKPGHWSYVPPHQLHGRWDNSDLYQSWYFSCTAVGAVAESFYNKRVWIPEVFLTPLGEARAIAEFTFSGGPLLDLDDAATLLEIGVRPSQVVVPDIGVTQDIARELFETYGDTHAGITWWSSQLPAEQSVLLWAAGGEPPAGLSLDGIQPLSTAHPAVIEAAGRLYRPLG